MGLPGNAGVPRQDARDHAAVARRHQGRDSHRRRTALVVSAADQEAEIAEDEAAGADVRRVPSERPQTKAAENGDGQRRRQVVDGAAEGHHAPENEQGDGVGRQMRERAVHQGRAEDAREVIRTPRDDGEGADEAIVHEQAVDGHRPHHGDRGARRPQRLRHHGDQVPPPPTPRRPRGPARPPAASTPAARSRGRGAPLTHRPAATAPTARPAARRCCRRTRPPARPAGSAA